jgi:hypothetical protein
LFELLLIIGRRKKGIATALAAGMSNIWINPAVVRRTGWLIEDRRLSLAFMTHARSIFSSIAIKSDRSNISDRNRGPKEVSSVSALLISFPPADASETTCWTALAPGIRCKLPIQIPIELCLPEKADRQSQPRSRWLSARRTEDIPSGGRRSIARNNEDTPQRIRLHHNAGMFSGRWIVDMAYLPNLIFRDDSECSP